MHICFLFFKKKKPLFVRGNAIVGAVMGLSIT